MSPIVFQAWPKIPRFRRDMIISEKIDGTNAAVGIIASNQVHGDVPSDITFVCDDRTDDHQDYIIYAQSRRRLITPADDNYGFAKWVEGNAAHLVDILGPGLHFGEWWGLGVQRGYGLNHKKFSLFNTSRWHWLNDPEARLARAVPAELDVVPVIRHHTFSSSAVDQALDELRSKGSFAAPGFMNPEGVVIFHTASGSMFKATLDGDQAKNAG